MGWLTGWTYRKKHTIDQTANAGTDYQIGIKVYKGVGVDGTEVVGGITMGKVYCGGNCKNDFGDIRFTESDGETELSYWADPVNYVNGTSRVFWVEVSDDISAGNVDIYIYYDNAGATTTSNFDNTFIFGDPFDNVVLDAGRWTSVDGGPVYSIDTVNHCLVVTDCDPNTYNLGKGFHSKLFTMSAEWVIEDAYSGNGVRRYVEAITSCMTYTMLSLHHLALWTSVDWGVSFALVADAWADEASVAIWMGVGGNVDWSLKRAGHFDHRHKHWKCDGTIRVTEDGVVKVIEANSEVPDRIHLGIARYSTYCFSTARFYAFKVRKYTCPEPVHNTWGSEEAEVSFQGERSSVVLIMKVLNII